MTFLATVLTAVIVQLAPPPQVKIIQLRGEDVSVEARMATQTILDKLQPAYVLVRPSTLPTEDFGRCWTQQRATEDCLAHALDRVGAETGEVILAFWEADGVLHWLCVGKSGRPFTDSRQSAALGPLADLYRDGESEVLHQADGLPHLRWPSERLVKPWLTIGLRASPRYRPFRGNRLEYPQSASARISNLARSRPAALTPVSC